MRKFVVRPLLLAVGFIVSACGGGGDFQPLDAVMSATSPAKFASTDDVASIVFWASAAPQYTYGDYRGVNDSSVSGSPLAKSRGSKSEAEGSRAKATSSACSGGGSQTYEENPNTQYPFDGTYIASNCAEINPSQPSIIYSRDGQAVLACTDAQPSDDCYNFTAAYGVSGKPYLYGFKNTEAPPIDVLTKLLLINETSYIQLESSTPVRDVFSGSMELIDTLAGVSTNVHFDKFRQVYHYYNGKVSITLDGVFGVISSMAKCSIGKVTVKTNSPIIYQNDDATSEGRLTITDGAGQSAGVQYNSDGSATITLGGASKVYTADQLENSCN